MDSMKAEHQSLVSLMNFALLALCLCGCNEVTKFAEKKYTPVYVYLSTIPYVSEAYLPDFVDYPNDLAKFGLRGAVKEVKVSSAGEMVQKFDEDGKLITQGTWFDSSHRFGEEYRWEYDDKGRLVKLNNTRTKWHPEFFVYDEWDRLTERKAEDYTRFYQYAGEGKSNYTAHTEGGQGMDKISFFFSETSGNRILTFEIYSKPEGYRIVDGNTRMRFQAKYPATQLCPNFTKTYYPDPRYYKNKIDSVVNTFQVSYNDKEDVKQCLIHSVEHPSGKTWDCRIDYLYQYDEHDNWIEMKLYCAELRKLLGDFIVIKKDEEGKTYTADSRTISYYETEIGDVAGGAGE